MEQKRVALLLIYMVLFLFSIASIIHIRYTIYKEGIQDYDGSFTFLGLSTDTMTHNKFIVLKLSLFVFIGIASFVLMLSEYYLFEHPGLEDRVFKGTHREIKKIVSKKK